MFALWSPTVLKMAFFALEIDCEEDGKVDQFKFHSMNRFPVTVASCGMHTPFITRPVLYKLRVMFKFPSLLKEKKDKEI